MTAAIDYSVVIRTTGKAGEKYRALLESITNLNPQPVEVIVVLPDTCERPTDQIGIERFCFCKKGMVRQRMMGLEECHSRYALFCDDDIWFEPNFVKKLYEPLAKGIGSFSTGPLFSFLPPKGFNAILCTVMASAVPTVFHKKDRYISILKSSGYSYNRTIDTSTRQCYYTQAVPWTCFFADTEAFRNLEFEKEEWVDLHGYSALDDQAMFYKAWLFGMKTVVVSNALYEHLDAKTSTQNNNKDVIYSRMFNRTVFWHRFIYSIDERPIAKVSDRIAFEYAMIWLKIRNYSLLKRNRINAECYEMSRQGLKDAWDYINSDAYRSLPCIKKAVTI